MNATDHKAAQLLQTGSFSTSPDLWQLNQLHYVAKIKHVKYSSEDKKLVFTRITKKHIF